MHVPFSPKIFAAVAAAAALAIAVFAQAGASGPNLVTNGTFDNSTGGWAAWQFVPTAWNGDHSMRVSNPLNSESDAHAFQCVNTQAGHQYHLSGDIKLPLDLNRVVKGQLGLQWHDGFDCQGAMTNFDLSSYVSITGFWLPAAIDTTAPANSKSVLVYLNTYKGPAGPANLNTLVWADFDNIVLTDETPAPPPTDVPGSPCPPSTHPVPCTPPPCGNGGQPPLPADRGPLPPGPTPCPPTPPPCGDGGQPPLPADRGPLPPGPTPCPPPPPPCGGEQPPIIPGGPIPKAPTPCPPPPPPCGGKQPPIIPGGPIPKAPTPCPPPPPPCGGEQPPIIPGGPIPKAPTPCPPPTIPPPTTPPCGVPSTHPVDCGTPEGGTPDGPTPPCGVASTHPIGCGTPPPSMPPSSSTPVPPAGDPPQVEKQQDPGGHDTTPPEQPSSPHESAIPLPPATGNGMASANDVPWRSLVGAALAGIAASLGLAAFARRPR